ncbi:MAG TPA: hypothetical protein VG270_03550, partial [Pseudolabrys sp.]|nr:hypothetical protein [Pseudolabrys sp.]
MKSDSSWTLKGRPPDPRETARAGSGRSGISVGDWLNSVVEPAGPEHTPPQADYDDRDEVDDRVPSPRREEIPAPRNHQTWWRRWRGGANPTDAKEPPRRETRRLREPAMAPAPS